MIIVVSRNIDIKTKIGFNESFATVVLKFNLEMILKIYPRTKIRRFTKKLQYHVHPIEETKAVRIVQVSPS